MSTAGCSLVNLNFAYSSRSASGCASRTSTSSACCALIVSRSFVSRCTCEIRTLTAKPPTTTQGGSSGNRPSAATNEWMRPPVSPTRMTRSPGTCDVFGLPLLEDLQPAGLVRGDVERDDDVIRDRPDLAAQLRAVLPTKAHETNRRNGDSASATLGLLSLAEKPDRAAQHRSAWNVEVRGVVTAGNDRHAPRGRGKRVGQRPARRCLGCF